MARSVRCNTKPASAAPAQVIRGLRQTVARGYVGNNMRAFSSTIAEVFGPPAGVSASALTAPDNSLTLARCQPSIANADAP